MKETNDSSRGRPDDQRSPNNSKIQHKTSDTVVVSSLTEKENCNDPRHDDISIATFTETIEKDVDACRIDATYHRSCSNSFASASSSAARWRPPTPPPIVTLSSSPSATREEISNDEPKNEKRKWFQLQVPFIFYKQKQPLKHDDNLQDGFSALADDSLVLSSNQSTECNREHNHEEEDVSKESEDLQLRQQQAKTFEFHNIQEGRLLEPSGNQTKKYSSTNRKKKISNKIHKFLGKHAKSGREVHHDHYIQYGNGDDHFHDNDSNVNGNDQDDDREQQSYLSSSNYQMMKSQHGSSRSQQVIRMVPECTSLSLEEETSFFYTGMDQLERERKRQICTTAIGHVTSPHSLGDPTSSSFPFFTHQTRRKFVEEHALLNLPLEIKPDSNGSDTDSDMDYDFTTLFTFGCSPLARERSSRNSVFYNNGQESQVPAIADIRKSSLSYIRQGRIEMRLPGDNIRLVMDEFIEPGILSVEMDVEQGRDKVSSCPGPTKRRHDDACQFLKRKGHDQQESSLHGEDNKSRLLLQQQSHDNYDDIDDEDCGAMNDGIDTSERETPLLQKLVHDGNHVNKRPPDLRYILTVDQNLYKRIFSEMADSRMPCGLYFCCHDAVDGSKSVDISVAVFILIVVFVLLFIGTCTWPTA